MTADRERELQGSLTKLAEVLTCAQPLTDTLQQMAAFAVTAIPGADGVGLTLIEPHGPDTMVASAEFVRAVDGVQYGLGEGPCLLAVELRAPQRSGSLGGEPRWPRFGPRAGRMGVHSVLSLPLILGDRVVGTLNVYGLVRDAFDESSVTVGERFAGAAAVTATHALLLEESRRTVVRLEQTRDSRAVIDQALGIIMSRTGLNSEEAFEKLRRRSQADDLKVAEVARKSSPRRLLGPVTGPSDRGPARTSGLGRSTGSRPAACRNHAPRRHGRAAARRNRPTSECTPSVPWVARAP